MRKNKRFLALAIAVTLGVSMTGCGTQKTQENVETAAPADDTETASEEAVALTEDTEPEESQDNTEKENMIKNGDFSDGLTNWNLYIHDGEAVQTVNGDGEMEIQITDPGELDYSIQPYYDGFSLEQGCVYEFSFDVRSSVERTMEWRLQLNGGDYHAYVSDLITTNEETQHVTDTFTMTEDTDPAPRLCINMGRSEGRPGDMKENTVYLDNFELYLVDSSGKVETAQEETAVYINVNQVGYLPEAKKIAVVRGELGTNITGSFDVVKADTGEVVFSGELKDTKENAASGEQTAQADFSSVKEAGTYKIVTDHYGESYEFTIGDSVYDNITQSALRMFYLQRCGEKVEDDVFSHESCHTGDAVVAGDTSGDTHVIKGGWHDAGDYGRYTVAGAKAAADLMLAYEAYGDAFGDDSGIPESGNGTPDILDEVKYELDWMLSMQDKGSGGVYHKITCAVFPDTVMPEEETDQLILSPVSTTATADFAAVMAMAARVFEDTDPSYAKTCLAAAKDAWKYLEQTPNDGVGFQNPDTVSTGSYDDPEDADERYWALAELYKTTGEKTYLTALKKYAAENIICDLSWRDVGAYGMYAYLTSGDKADAYYKSVEKCFVAKADEAVQNAKADAYGAAIGLDGYYWGSNMGIADRGMLLLMANKLQPNQDYVTAAGEQLNYLLGTNTTSYCFVTGFGSLSPQHPHHRPSQVKGEPASGMLVGGPDSNLDDSYAQAVLSGKPAAACYADDEQSYSCNEITIYWNSPLVYLLMGIGANLQ